MLLIVGCHQANPNRIALAANMHKKLYKTKEFTITSYVRANKYLSNDKPIIVYIEGDGRAWLSRYKLSNNPTPFNPLTLKLATIDRNPNVIYIARPCQFTPLDLEKNCLPKYWSEARYSKKVVDSINQVIEDYKNSIFITNASKATKAEIHLVGYSGGATIAGLIASQRSDVKSLRTIAGNLDHDAVSDFHQTTKLNQSLNLIDFTENIKHIPQFHYIGERDQIIPIDVVKNFVDKVNSYTSIHCASYKIFNNIDHYRGWEAVWQQIFTQIPSCH